MFDDGGGDGGDGGFGWGQALFAFLLWRELDSGRLTLGGLIAGILGLLLGLAAIGLGILVIVGIVAAFA